MHSGVFGARISEEAFQILIDILESNFAALNLPEDNVTSCEENNNAVVVSRRTKLPDQVTRENYPVIFEENLNIRVSHFIQNHNGQEFRGVFEIVLPISRNPHPLRLIMNHEKSLDDSHEPMEVEEMSYTKENNCAEAEFDLRKVKQEPNDTGIPEVSRPKIIIRESKLKILEKNKVINDNEKIPVISNLSAELKQNTINDPDSQKIKSKLRPLVVKKQDSTVSEKSTFFYFWQMLFFILFPIAVLIACVAIAREEFDSTVCAHRFDATGAIRDLENRIFGQTRGIKELGENLAANSSGFKILAIIGGTGVGKSYAAHIISENFPVKRNVFQYVPPLKPKRRFASGAISICGCNLIIIENLNNRDVLEAVQLAEHIAGKIDEQNYCVIIINVINVQETDENLKHEVNLTRSKIHLENIYREKNLDVKVIRFENLDDETITRCIIEAGKSRNLTLSKNEIDDVRISLKISNSGCKGASAKVQLLDNKPGRD